MSLSTKACMKMAIIAKPYFILYGIFEEVKLLLWLVFIWPIRNTTWWFGHVCNCKDFWLKSNCYWQAWQMSPSSVQWCCNCRINGRSLRSWAGHQNLVPISDRRSALAPSLVLKYGPKPLKVSWSSPAHSRRMENSQLGTGGQPARQATDYRHTGMGAGKHWRKTDAGCTSCIIGQDYKLAFKMCGSALLLSFVSPTEICPFTYVTTDICPPSGVTHSRLIPKLQKKRNQLPRHPLHQTA